MTDNPTGGEGLHVGQTLQWLEWSTESRPASVAVLEQVQFPTQREPFEKRPLLRFRPAGFVVQHHPPQRVAPGRAIWKQLIGK
ncbi:MAG: hypothetical protein ACKO3P_22285 [Planctomycetaceae bacterium]